MAGLFFRRPTQSQTAKEIRPPQKFLNFDTGIAKAIIFLSAPIMKANKAVYREKGPLEEGFALAF